MGAERTGARGEFWRDGNILCRMLAMARDCIFCPNSLNCLKRVSFIVCKFYFKKADQKGIGVFCLPGTVLAISR